MDIRSEFLKFFEKKAHVAIPSAPLVPNDSTLLFTNAGMVPFKSIFTGDIPAPNPPRATSCQTCIRAGGKHNDLDNVGYTARHHTFFEMLGNFSFGDYFKEEAISFAWEFIVDVIKLPKDKLWVTVHENDDEAYKIWQKYVHQDRILKLGDKDNFWQMGDTGPCGPCSEIFFDQGSENFNGPEDYMGGDGDRFLEIWNLVFMQYERFNDGSLKPLPKPSIDTGMGLERITAVKNGALSNYDTPLFMPLIEKVADICKQKYEYKTGASYRVIADHIRSVSFLLAQGVNFDKEGRGYVLRRILRRAVRHGYLLGIRKPFMHELVDVLSKIMGDHYTYIKEKKNTIKEQILLEEERFFATIASGLELFEVELTKTKELFSGGVAFKLYDTFGFPLDLTQDMLRDKNIQVDMKTFDELMQEQKQRAKANWKGSGDRAVNGEFRVLLDKIGVNDFVYEEQNLVTKVVALMDEDFKVRDYLKSGETGWVMLEKTPFYPRGGGQCSDIGEIVDFGFVDDTQKFFDINLSHVSLSKEIKVGDEVKAKVDFSRLEIQKHHSATHLLHLALREILGSNVAQAGSLVEKNRLRFDFSFPRALNEEELKNIENMVNGFISSAKNTSVEFLDIEEAKSKGAIALFGEKYSQNVRVISMGDSMELCGGTHVKNTSEIGIFFIIKESGVSAGVRRIEAVCGNSALSLANSWRNQLAELSQVLKHKDLKIGVQKLLKETQELKNQVQKLEANIKKDVNFYSIGDAKIVIDEIGVGDIKQAIDELKNQNEKIAILLFQVLDDKVIIASGVKNLPVKAGEWIKDVAPIVGGGGGGRDDFAQAGGKNIDGIKDAKKRAFEFITNKIKS